MKYLTLRLKLKIRALIDVISSKKFYLITFDEDTNVKWRTEYNINPDEIHDKI